MKYCHQCGDSLPTEKSIQGYAINNHPLCKKCFDEIMLIINRPGGWKYEDVPERNKLYPKILID